MKNTIVLLVGLILALSACAKKEYVVTIKTSYGDMKVILYNQTPEHKENFLKLAQSGDYDSTTFHRVIEGFMIQGGGVDMKPENKGETFDRIPAEFVDTLIHHKGALAAARMGDDRNPNKESSGCQWYIVQGIVFEKEQLTTDMAKINEYLMQLIQKPEYAGLQEEVTKIYYEQGEEAFNKKLIEMKPVLEEEYNVSFDQEFPADRLEIYTTVGGAPHLDDNYTVFGRVVEGFEVIDKIAAVETGGRDTPVEDIYITMEVESMGLKKFNKLYGSN